MASRKGKTYRLTCEVCMRTFTAGSPRAKRCSETCKTRARRAQERAAAEQKRQEETPEHELVLAVRTALREADASKSIDGLLAVHLALAVAAAESAGKVGPVDRLRVVLEAATGRSLTPEPESDEEPEDDGQQVVDEVLAARDRKRDAARAAG